MIGLQANCSLSVLSNPSPMHDPHFPTPGWVFTLFSNLEFAFFVFWYTPLAPNSGSKDNVFCPWFSTVVAVVTYAPKVVFGPDPPGSPDLAFPCMTVQLKDSRFFL